MVQVRIQIVISFYECEFRLRRDELGERIFEHIQKGDMTEEQRDILRLRYYPDFA